MKLKDLIIIAITIACCWLVFKNNQSSNEIDILEKRSDSLSLVDQKYQAQLTVNKIKAAQDKAEFEMILNQVNKDHAERLRNEKKYIRRLDSRINNMDSSSAVSALSEWLVRETGESLFKGN